MHTQTTRTNPTPTADNKGLPRKVYLIRCERTEATKIGISVNPARRVAQLQTGTSSRLTLLFEFHSRFPSLVEGALHRLFADRRVSGEWYDVKPSETDWVVKQCISIERSLCGLKSGADENTHD